MSTVGKITNTYHLSNGITLLRIDSDDSNWKILPGTRIKITCCDGVMLYTKVYCVVYQSGDIGILTNDINRNSLVNAVLAVQS